MAEEQLVVRTSHLVPGCPDCVPGVGALPGNAGQGLQHLQPQTLSCTAGEGGPSPQGWVGEG